MSLTAPSDTFMLHSLLSHKQQLLDAPVSGGVKRAIENTLALMVGGSHTDFDPALPLFDETND